jgi:hypothetical protein
MASNVDEYNKKLIGFVNETLEEFKNISENITLLIFTGGIRKAGLEPQWFEHSHENDVDWVMQFKSDNESKYNIHISPGTLENDEIVDYELMTNCDYLITPHQSTFSFMAYYSSKKIKKLYSPTNLYGGLFVAGNA